jgi:acetyl esterase
VTAVDPQARALVERWAAEPSVPLSELTARTVREEELAVLELQATPGPLHAVDDIELPGPAGPLAARLYRPRPGRLPVVLYLPGGGFVLGPGG